METWRIYGRTVELDRLTQDIRQLATTRGPRVTVVTGEAGLGKTRLVDEAVRLTAISPIRRLTGFEPERMVPLAAATHLLRDLTAESVPSADRLRGLLDSPGGSAGLEAVRLFEAAASVLVDTTPALLVVDDLHWLDELTRAFLHHAVRAAAAEAASLGFLIASRPTPEAVVWMEAVRSIRGSFDELKLGPLEVAAGVALAQAQNSSLSEDAGKKIWAGAGGSPFWISLLSKDDGRGGSEPLAALTSLLRLLTGDAARYLAAIVVFGQPVDPDEVRQVLDWQPPRAESALGELIRRGVVHETEGLVAPVHDVLRETAIAQLSERERRHLHSRIAAHLRSRAGSDGALLMQALNHAIAAGDDAGGIALEFASSPTRRVLGQEAIECLAAVADGATISEPVRLDLNRHLAQLAEDLGHTAGAAARLEWLSRMAPTRSERADAAARAAKHLFWLDDLERAQELLARARVLPGDPWTLVLADALDANRLLWTGEDRRRAEESRVRAVNSARKLVADRGGLEYLNAREQSAYVEALDAERYARLVADDIPGLLQVSEEYADATTGMGALHLEGLAQPAWTLRFFNRWEDVARQQRAVMAEAERQVYPAVAASLAYELALTSYHLGDIAEAARMHDEARRLHARIDAGHVETSDTWLVGLRPLIDASAVDWRAGIDALVATAAGQTNSHARLLNHLRAAMVAARFDSVSRRSFVRDQVAEANEHANVAACPRCLAEVEIVSVDALARITELDDAEARLATWNAAHPDPNPRFGFQRDWATALLAKAHAKPETTALLEGVAEIAASGGMQLDRLWVFLDLADWLASSDPTRATQVLAEAATLATALGASSERALAESRRRQLGGRTSTTRRRPAQLSVVAGLSPRELEVARLAARGARNTEIAESLFLSTKTVEQHLSRVFAKLEVRNRAELVGRYAQLLA